ncbi:MAG: hypothetical protein RLZZ04_804 [Cyanobacteriota bacterium]|jgi:hypothetical protein
MKLAHIYKFSSTGLLAIALTVIPFKALGQAQTETPQTDSVEVVTREDNNFDWGWLGLLGLLGLAGLAGKKSHQDSNTHREVDNVQPFPESPVSRGDSQYR